MTMRKYLKPALEIEAFDVEDTITVSGNNGTSTTPGGIDGGVVGQAGAPIDAIELN